MSTHTCRQTLNTACCHISKLHQVKVVKNTAVKVIHVLSTMFSVFGNVVLKNNPSYLMYYLQYNHCSWDFFFLTSTNSCSSSHRLLLVIAVYSPSSRATYQVAGWNGLYKSLLKSMYSQTLLSETCECKALDKQGFLYN